MAGQGYACAWVESAPTRTGRTGYGYVSFKPSLGVRRMVFRRTGQ